MPHITFPDFIGTEVRLTTYCQKPTIQFKYDARHVKTIQAAGGVLIMNTAFVPLDSPSLQPPVGPPDVEIYKIDSALRLGFLREKVRRFENMEFPPNTQAIVFDTDSPVDQSFADNFLGFCTGMIGQKTKTSWMNHFYDDLGMGDDITPYAKRAILVKCDGILYPASPWTTPGWQSDGMGRHAHMATFKVLSGEEVEPSTLLTNYQWPSRMSVAIFFRKRFDSNDLLLNMLKKRAEIFCGLYSTGKEGKLHRIQDVRWVDTALLKFWNGWDNESYSRALTSARSSRAKNRKHEYVPEEYCVDYSRRQKVGIEDISTSNFDL